MIKNIISGMTMYGAAFRHISKHGLWLYVLLPGIISLILAGLVGSFAYGLSDDLGGVIDGFWKWEFGRSIVEKIAQVFGGLLILIIGAILFKQILMVVLSPFMSILSAKVEEQVTGIKSDAKFSVSKAIADVSRGLRIAIRNVTRELLATAILFIIGLIPVVTPFTTALIFLIQSYYAGFGNTDFTLERHYNYKNSIGFVKRNRSMTLGNGIVFMFLFLSVIGFLFAMPFSTVAATLQSLEKIEK